MTELEYKQAVHEILQDLKGINPLKELFWGELNYDRVNDSLSRHGWSKTATEALAEDPVLFASGGQDDGFHVIYSRLNSNRLLLGHERPVVSRLLRDHPYSLFVFSNETQNRWHFLNVKYDEESEKRRLFRRITIGPEERLRTATERLSLLDVDSIDKDLFGISPLAIQQTHDEAFDVEAVSNQFFKKYAVIFELVERSITGIDTKSKRLFTQKLFNRLMFIPFVEKKGWLNFNDQSEYLLSLWKNYSSNKSPKSNFYRDRLKLLFFSGLNTSDEEKGRGSDGEILSKIGNVPYLNGGLFDKEEEDYVDSILIPDQSIKTIINELFYKFNFTVTEATPIDIEVAVDPEMLGRVFEELVTGRHETGSYYTPKPVVSFMCKEALKGYLHKNFTKEQISAVESFIENHNTKDLKNPKEVLYALRKIKVCDPACGSGAYLLGMLHELIELRNCLFDTKNLDPLSDYERKLEIIQNNLWGVDIDPFAVNIARLRLWLSLIIEFEGYTPPPLPNLDYKIEHGDSLTDSNPEGFEQQGFREGQIKKYQEAKALYMTAHGDKKKDLSNSISAIKKEIEIWSLTNYARPGFDWAVEFAEIFIEKGFDIILANPPYVRADAQFKHIKNEAYRQAAISQWKEYRSYLKKSKIYQTLYEKWDFYIPFLERAFQLLKPNGQMVFIISDAYNASKYTKKSHEFFIGNTFIERIDFCTDIPLFKAGVYNTIVHFTKAPPSKNHEPMRIRRWGNSSDEFENNVEELVREPQSKLKENSFRPDYTPQEEFDGMQNLDEICYISYGLRANAHDRYWQGEFKTDDCLSSIKDKYHPKRFAQGKDLAKWFPKRIWFLEWGTSRAPDKFSRPTFIGLHENEEKLIAARTPGANPRVIYDNNSIFFDASSVGFIPWHLLKGVTNRSINKTTKYRYQNPGGDREMREKISLKYDLKYLLSIMNSTFAKNWLTARRRSKLHVYPNDWKQLPIPPIEKREQMVFVNLVDEILNEYNPNSYPLPSNISEHLQDIETKIDKLVTDLYQNKE